MERAYELLREGYTPIVIAPTGYGKTTASPEIRDRACRDGISCGLIHIVPLRSLVYSIYKGVFEGRGGAYQMHDPLPRGEKSPYFLRSLVVTTIDSYMWNLYRIPVAEFSVVERRLTGGHYYPIYTSIFTSINIFDEAHLYLGTGDASINYAAVKASLSTLVRIGVPTIIETATLDSYRLKDLSKIVSEMDGKPLILRLKCWERDLVQGLNGIDVEEVGDWKWIDEHRIQWETILAKRWDDVIGDIVNDSSRGVVLVIANSVKRAVALYIKISRLVDKSNVYLIHGRLSERDRTTVESKLGSLTRGIIIGTQVVEAGVDVNAIAVYTELAPIENIAQRVGRACRRGKALDECKRVGGKLVIITGEEQGVYSRDKLEITIKTLKQYIDDNVIVDWRNPCSIDNAKSYTMLIEEVARRTTLDPTPWKDRALYSILERYLVKDAGPLGLLDLLSETGTLCSIYRNTVMAQIQTRYGPVTASLDWILANANDILVMGDNGAPIVTLVSITEAGHDEVIGEGEAIKLWDTWINLTNSRRFNCYLLNRALQNDISRIARGRTTARFTWRFKAREDAYQHYLGLLTRREYSSAG